MEFSSKNLYCIYCSIMSFRSSKLERTGSTVSQVGKKSRITKPGSGKCNNLRLPPECRRIEN
jgi:hypothetical protein